MSDRHPSEADARPARGRRLRPPGRPSASIATSRAAAIAATHFRRIRNCALRLWTMRGRSGLRPTGIVWRPKCARISELASRPASAFGNSRKVRLRGTGNRSGLSATAAVLLLAGAGVFLHGLLPHDDDVPDTVHAAVLESTGAGVRVRYRRGEHDLAESRRGSGRPTVTSDGAIRASYVDGGTVTVTSSLCGIRQSCSTALLAAADCSKRSSLPAFAQ